MSHSDGLQLITILGSTGSIGINTLKVIEANPARYGLFALTANKSVEALFQQCLQFKPRFAVMGNSEAAAKLRAMLTIEALEVEVLEGNAGLEYVASADEVHSVMAAIVGGAGLIPTLAAAKSGKKVLLANKEALVMAGEIFMSTVKDNGAQLLPIDSEHNAIFQCLPINQTARFEEDANQGFEKIVLTASGGPFLSTPLDQMQAITPKQACAHPNWKMGPKISVDSATMLNKALELIEASLLFATAVEKIEILIHPQSIVHSMVHYRDGSVLAQLGNPDMRTPIAYGLAWPQRINSGVASLNLAELGALEFFSPDDDKFPGLKLGKQAAHAQGSAPIILNASNEEAVAAFLAGSIRFVEIPVIIDAVLNQQEVVKTASIEDVLFEDHKARKLTGKIIEKIMM